MALDLKKQEKEILDFWEKNKIFEKSVENRRGKTPFVFFEGPPTANGLPGIHHFLARVYKDLFCRYKTMRGFYVLRKGGWDTHGLPVELEVEKELGLKSKKEVEEYGIAKFNEKAKESVWKYLDEWEKFTRDSGFWIDLDNPYVTYKAEYIESLWNIIKEIDKKGLLYKDFRVVPYCPHCGTPLSSHEVALGYKNIEEPAVYIKFKVKEEDAYILSWTTTPWTLPGNVALAVGENIDYVKIDIDNEKYILAKSRHEALGLGGKILEEMKGGDLVGMEYEPLFDIPKLQSDASYKVYAADFVTTEDGSGVVHTAVMYGEEDFDLGTKFGLPKVHTVDEEGNFMNDVGYDLAGLYVKSPEAEKKIIQHLKKNNLLFKTEAYKHDYPFCWRCASPLLYYAADSWFVRMTAVKDQLLENNKKINWVPSHVKEGRFGEWLENVRDWVFSRRRFWGTPLPIWVCEKCGYNKVIGSLKELDKNAYKKRDGKNYPYNEKGELDLHRPYIDAVELKCEKCGGKSKRIEDVADVWFDSGSMPYAQWHYPFENKEIFKEQFPADFVAEGMDQTRGWFYTLVAVATVLGLGPAFKNVVSLGLVLDDKGKKMSKSLGNVIKPDDVIDQFGADSARWHFYTLNSAGESKLYSLEDVRGKMRSFVITLLNSLRFLELYVRGEVKQSHGEAGDTVLDKWIISRLNSLILGVTKEMDKYDATSAARMIEEFVVEDLSKWWIRRSRERFQNPRTEKEYFEAVKTLRFVLLELDKLIAPFTPFLAEQLHRRLHFASSPETESVHLHDWPEADERNIDKKLEEKMVFAREIVTQGLAARKKNQIKVRQPLAKLFVKSNRFDNLEKGLSSLIEDELNVKEVIYEKNDVLLEVSLDTEITTGLKHEGWIREFMRQIQEMRKEGEYKFDEKVYAKWQTNNEELAQAVRRFSDAIVQKTILSKLDEGNLDAVYDVKREFELDTGVKIHVAVRK